MKLRKAEDYELIGYYRYGKHYYVEIIERKECFEAYLWHEQYGIKNMMFGVSKDTSIEKFIELVEANIEEYIIYYREEFVDHDDLDEE